MEEGTIKLETFNKDLEYETNWLDEIFENNSYYDYVMSTKGATIKEKESMSENNLNHDNNLFSKLKSLIINILLFIMGFI